MSSSLSPSSQKLRARHWSRLKPFSGGHQVHEAPFLAKKCHACQKLKNLWPHISELTPGDTVWAFINLCEALKAMKPFKTLSFVFITDTLLNLMHTNTTALCDAAFTMVTLFFFSFFFPKCFSDLIVWCYRRLRFMVLLNWWVFLTFCPPHVCQ